MLFSALFAMTHLVTVTVSTGGEESSQNLSYVQRGCQGTTGTSPECCCQPAIRRTSSRSRTLISGDGDALVERVTLHTFYLTSSFFSTTLRRKLVSYLHYVCVLHTNAPHQISHVAVHVRSYLAKSSSPHVFQDGSNCGICSPLRRYLETRYLIH